MSTVKQIIYDTPDQNKFIHDVTEILIDEFGAEFVLEDNSIIEIQNYLNDAGFTYDPALVEFVAGALKHKKKVYANELLGISASLQNNEKADRFQTSDVAAPINGASLANLNGNQWLDVSGSVQSRRWEYDPGNAQFGQIGTIRFKVVSKYAGAPANNKFIYKFNTQATSANQLVLFHQATGLLNYRIYNQAGALAIAANVGPWTPAIDQEDEFEINHNFLTGETRLFINGVLNHSVVLGAFSRGTIDYLSIGADGTAVSEYLIRDFQVFDTVQHTADFAGEIPRNVPNYPASNANLPTIDYVGPGIVKSIDSVVNTGDNAPPYTQSFDDDSIDVELNFEDTYIQQSIESTEVTYTGEFYPEDSIIEPTEYSLADGFEDLFHDIVLEGDAQLNYIVKIENSYYYIVGGVLTTTDKSFSQSNTIVEWLANKAIVDAFILNGARLTMLPVPYSGINKDSNFKLVSTTTTYGFFALPVSCTKCTLYGFVKSNCQDIVSGTVRLYTKDPIFTQGNSEAFDQTEDIKLPNGFFEIELVIPNLPLVVDRTNDVYYLDMRWIDADGKSWKRMGVKVLIPNATTVLFDENIIVDD